MSYLVPAMSHLVVTMLHLVATMSHLVATMSHLVATNHLKNILGEVRWVANQDKQPN